MMRYVTVGLSVLAAVAAFEVALIPAVAIGGAAILAPTFRLGFINLQHFCHSRWRNPVRLSKSGQGFVIGRRLAKTITFRMIATAVEGLWLCRRSVCLSRSRNGVGLFHCAETAPVRTATDGKPRAGDQPAARRCVDSQYSGAACDRFAALQPFTPPCRKISGRGITIRRSGRVPDVGATVISLPARWE
jgi:hypothetical protein